MESYCNFHAGIAMFIRFMVQVEVYTYFIARLYCLMVFGHCFLLSNLVQWTLNTDDQEVLVQKCSQVFTISPRSHHVHNIAKFLV